MNLADVVSAVEHISNPIWNIGTLLAVLGNVVVVVRKFTRLEATMEGFVERTNKRLSLIEEQGSRPLLEVAGAVRQEQTEIARILSHLTRNTEAIAALDNRLSRVETICKLQHGGV